MAIVTDRQVRCWRTVLKSGKPLKVAAMRLDMDRKTARKYRDLARLPSELEGWPRAWRTREDPCADVWEEVREKLELSPGLQANTLFAWLPQRYPGRFPNGQLRTLQRRLRQGRAAAGPPTEVFFAQTHHPGRLGASDFTPMTSLNVTLAGQPFDHMVYHFVLTYSNWETASLGFSESFESLSDGLQQALWELGGVPQPHRTDRISAAVNNWSDPKEFTRRDQALIGHSGLILEKINAREAHENGDAEPSHNRFQPAVDQALQLRGNRDFPDRIASARFLRAVLDQGNAGRQQHLAEERAALAPLPLGRLESYKRARVRVGAGSEIRVDRNTSSIPSRLAGEPVDVRLDAEHLEVWYGGGVVERMPRLRGQGKHRINYRHVIDSLVRKPGAFENSKDREDMFPTSRFRMADDALRQTTPNRAARESVPILELAARENESLVDDALRMLLEEDQAMTLAAVKHWVGRRETARLVTDVQVEFTNLSSFDEWFRHKEVWDGIGVGGETTAGGVPSRAPSAHVS